MKTMGEYRRVTRAHIAQLQEDLGQARQRAELAEKQTRDLAVELDRWKRRALGAEAELQSTGVTA